jgi:hypothetical protein
MPLAGKFFIFCFLLVEVIFVGRGSVHEDLRGNPRKKSSVSEEWVAAAETQVPKCEAPGAPGLEVTVEVRDPPRRGLYLHNERIRQKVDELDSPGVVRACAESRDSSRRMRRSKPLRSMLFGA